VLVRPDAPAAVACCTRRGEPIQTFLSGPVPSGLPHSFTLHGEDRMRRLVICADGTWNTADERKRGAKTPTNVTRMARTICPVADDGTSQIIYYQQGVGTHMGLDRLLGGAFGHGIDLNIQDAYRFLVDNYADGDELFLFGFSRGAYTVRSLVGMVRKCGILLPEHTDMIPEAYWLYRSGVHPRSETAQRFRLENAKETRVKFIGVWDTVGSLGIPVRFLNVLTRKKYAFHDVTLSSHVDNAFHALAVDERRGPFSPTLWAVQPRSADQPPQRVEQVWFAGVHSNVGGGYPDAGLSDCAFRWMVEKAKECGLAFDEPHLAALIHADPAGKLENSLRGFRLFGAKVRQVGPPRADEQTGEPIETCEDVHESVHERMKRVPDYRPPNLDDYLRRAAAAATVPIADAHIPGGPAVPAG
jgi:uncharacterized protein (DUF2235 family)